MQTITFTSFGKTQAASLDIAYMERLLIAGTPYVKVAPNCYAYHCYGEFFIDWGKGDECMTSWHPSLQEALNEFYEVVTT